MLNIEANIEDTAGVDCGRPVGSVDASLAMDIQGVSVVFRAYKQRPTTLKESLLQRLVKGKVQHYSTFDALKDINFSVKKGQVFGIIGSNGAGKSTLLRVLAGVLPPTSGKVVTNGTTDSLIQLGAGFDPDLNAIENIYLNGSLHQQSKKFIEARVPHILEFADLQEFAYTPIKYYSSGMSARLGFSVAIDRDPDILIVDEVLAVGDERFQEKCKAYFDQLIAAGKTLIIVTHSLGMVESLADEVILLSAGKIVFQGTPADAVARYRDPDYQTRLHST